MKTTVIAAVASLGLTVGGAARPERPHVAHVQLAAGGGSHPQADSNEHATQLAAGNHPQAETNERAIQLAASGSIPSASPMATTPEQYLGKRAHGTMKRIVLASVIALGLLTGGAAIVERAFVSRSAGPHYFGHLATSEAGSASYSL